MKASCFSKGVKRGVMRTVQAISGSQGNNDVPSPGAGVFKPHPIQLLFFLKGLGELEEAPLIQGGRTQFFCLDTIDAILPASVGSLQASSLWHSRLTPEMDGNDRLPPGGTISAAEQSTLSGPAPPKTETVSDTLPPDVSGDEVDELQPVEIDATLDGISREGLLQLLRELQQQAPELLRLLPVQDTSHIDALPTEKLRSLVEHLLNLAEAADAHGTAHAVGADSEESSATASRCEVKLQHAQPTQPPQLQKQQEDSRTEYYRGKQQPKKVERDDRRHEEDAADVQSSQRAVAEAAATVNAAASAAAVEAHQMLEIGSSEEEGEGLFYSLQEQLPVMQEADIWDLLVTMGPVLQALLPPLSPPGEHALLGQQQRKQNQQEGSTFDSVKELLDATREERRTLAAEAAAIRKFVEATVGPLSLEAKKDMLLTLLAVAEAEAYRPKDPAVRRLLGLDHPGARVPPSASAAGVTGAQNVAEQVPTMDFGGLPVVSAWRRLLQLPENAIRGESPLSAAEAEALNAEEVKLRYLRVVKQARQEGIKASLKRCNYMEHPESSVEGPKGHKFPAESLLDSSALQKPLESKPRTAESKASETRKSFEETVEPAETLRTVVPTESLEVSTGKGSAASQGGRSGDPQVQGESLLGLSREPNITLQGGSEAGHSESTFDCRRQAGLRGGAARFSALGLNEVVSSAAADFLGGAASRPTQTQRLVVPRILEAFKGTENKSRIQVAGKSSVGSLVALRAHTGSGKTLAFLLPLMQALREQEAEIAAAEKRRGTDEVEYTDLMDCSALADTIGAQTGPHRGFFGGRGPRALVVCPSRPLASQVASTAAALAKRIRLSVGCTTGGVGAGDQLRLLRRRPVDILIGTPDRLLRLTRPNPAEDRTFDAGKVRGSPQQINAGLPSLESVQFCILDEADASWLGGFRSEVEKLLIRSHFIRAVSQKMKEQDRAWGRPKILLTCTATPNSGIEADLCELLELPAERVLTVSGGPSFPPQTQLRHEMMQSRGTDRFLLLVEQIKIHPQLRAKKILVFCNTVDSCRACCHHLQEADIPAEGYDGSLPARLREKNLRSFQEGSGQRILVATDAVARGLHIGGVDAVVNLDFPLTAVEYLHRRTQLLRQLLGHHSLLAFLSRQQMDVLLDRSALPDVNVSYCQTAGATTVVMCPMLLWSSAVLHSSGVIVEHAVVAEGHLQLALVFESIDPRKGDCSSLLVEHACGRVTLA
ncbi:DEAD/DEAH box helicase, putative [Eimeria brunetti]|uniref:DEAD/DEAH box helicase, putative n=1 Tax=Eimeria brunetti TaxID=51314 RepID=U6LAN5_9EIME|nr:DEAD/DEAH box helicase, putative [Eimeria brunetti]